MNERVGADESGAPARFIVLQAVVEELARSEQRKNEKEGINEFKDKDGHLTFVRA